MNPDSHNRPNVVMVICDDLGYGDLGSYGGQVIKTPHLDALADDGFRFDAMYSGGPTCTPARSALLTGRLPARTGTQSVLFPGDEGMHLQEQTLANHLSTLEYRTMAVGKWHLGDIPGRGPLDFGFQSYFGLPYSNDMTPPSLYRDDRLIEEETDVSLLTARYIDECCELLDSVAPGTPFFLYLAHTMPHYPVTPDPRQAGRSAAGPYGDVVEHIDDGMGLLMAKLEAMGVADNTIVVFTSDHGPWYEGATGGFRGRKFDTWEGGTRVPFLLSWPGAKGGVIDHPSATVDVVATLLSELGVTVDETRPLDGTDLSPLFRHPMTRPDERPIWYFDSFHLNAVRLGRWKLHRRRMTFADFTPGQEAQAEAEQVSLPQLFDLEVDPTESYDVRRRHPDIAEYLLTLLDEMDQTLAADTSQAPCR